jgi:uncharacterized repeat protein (TIGR03803 family)
MKKTGKATLNFQSLRSHAAKLGMLLALSAALSALALRAQSASEKVLYTFNGAATSDGASVYSGVVLANDGRLYGTTWGGGSRAGGTVYRINTSGSGYTRLRSFGNGTDGSSIFAGLIQALDGMLYGTTYYGGISNAGTIFRIGTDGNGYQILRHFTDTPDASHPRAGLIQGQDGWLYGTTLYGGITNQGAVFKISPEGSDYTVLHNFMGNFVDGALPYAGLLQGHDGALYGVTGQGGSTLSGTVFRINTDGSGYQTLHTFEFGKGYWPRGTLVQGGDGMLYGTTYSGGPTNGGGVVYRLGTNGLDYTVLHAFPGGAQPWCQLVQASDGLIYGTTEGAGDDKGGTVFRLHPDGSDFAILHNFPFASETDGSGPIAGLIQGRDGALYGTTRSGGIGIGVFGTVYRLTVAPALNVSLSAQGPRVTLTGLSGQACRLDATTNCASWYPHANLVLTNGVAEFIETDAAGAASRLYRAVAQ